MVQQRLGNFSLSKKKRKTVNWFAKEAAACLQTFWTKKYKMAALGCKIISDRSNVSYFFIQKYDPFSLFREFTLSKVF